jgi:hypothetical protein
MHNIQIEFGLPKKPVALIKMCMHEVPCRIRKDLSDASPIQRTLFNLLWTMSSRDLEEAGIEMA